MYRILVLGLLYRVQITDTRSTKTQNRILSTFSCAMESLILVLILRKQNAGTRPTDRQTEKWYSTYYIAYRILVLGLLCHVQKTGTSPTISKTEY